MTLVPVIERELISQSRNRFTYLLRVIGAGAALLASASLVMDTGLAGEFGPALFQRLHQALFVSIWIVVPVLAADCISMERREGTIGILFLTPLKPFEIVLAKAAAHGVRAFTFWLATVPVMAIAFLAGGVTGSEGIMSVLVNVGAICCALSAGFFASAVCKRWLSSIVVALGLSGIFSMLFVWFTGWVVLLSLGKSTRFFLPGFFGISYDAYLRQKGQSIVFATGVYYTSNLFGCWGQVFARLPLTQIRTVTGSFLGIVIVAFLFLLASACIAAWCLKRVWQEGPPSAARARLERGLLTPMVGVGFYKRWLNRKLEQNPIGWLEMRSWTGRTIAWGWFAVVVSFYSAAFRSEGMSWLVPKVQELMMWGIFGVLALTSSGSFQRERETRVLEILLSSPVRTKDIISGRLRGLWGQIFPTFLLMVLVWFAYGSAVNHSSAFSFNWLIQCSCGFCCIPVIGLYYSLKRRTFVASFVSTLLAFFLPLLLIVASRMVMDAIWGDWYQGLSGSLGFYVFNIWRFVFFSPFFEPLILVIITLWCGSRLYRNLEHRKFVFT